MGLLCACVCGALASLLHRSGVTFHLCVPTGSRTRPTALCVSHCSFFGQRGVLVLAMCVCAMSSDRILPLVAYVAVAGTAHSGGRRDRTLYADSPPPPPCRVLVRKCRTMGAEGALRKFCLT